MNDLEVNEIIAEYMFKRDIDFVVSDYRSRQDVISRYYSYFTKYLDSLIPVWKKLKVAPTFYTDFNDENEHASCVFDEFKDDPDWYNTIQKAAAYATAKAILELKELK